MILPCWLRESVKPLKLGYPKRTKLLVFDTETCDGTPYLLTCYDGKKVKFRKVTKDTILDEFFFYLKTHCTSKKNTYILFCHNLPFDISAVFDGHRHVFAFRNSTFLFKEPETEKTIVETKLFLNKVWFVQVKFWNGISFKIVDTASFLKGSLFDLSRALNLKYKKLERPFFVGQGKSPLNHEEWHKLYVYCYHEILAQYELAKYILEMHERYNVTLTVSIAQLASKIFRKHFLKEPIPQSPDPVRWLAEETIHGGRAGVFGKTPCLIPDVSMYDYNSFYPFCMANLPNITKGEWTKTHVFDDEHEGFYRISGYVKPCKYPLVVRSKYQMDFASNEYVKDIPIASYELREALESNELDLKEIRGYVWKPSSEGSNPFRDYVQHFYDLKESLQKDNPLHDQAKLLLNSLYGKTYQTMLDPESEYAEDYRVYPEQRRIEKIPTLHKAGGLYLPHVGSWVTSQSRAILHRALHEYQGLDCATDSFKTTLNVPTSQGLGQLKKECEGLLLLLRPKLYVMFSKDRQKEILENGDFHGYLRKEQDSMVIGKDIVKFALHGFQRNVYTLLAMVGQDKHEYYVRHMVKIREALKQNIQPRMMVNQKRGLRLNWQELSSLTVRC